MTAGGLLLRAGGLGLACLALSACGGAARWEQAPAPAATPVVQASHSDPTAPASGRSARGNPPFYEVFGRRYYVRPTSAGYSEEGVASWYGQKFHGRPTSSGERYDMHAMTAAHKTLPLPTRVRVTNLGNGRSVVVTVNDRGPFVDNRIIDLSYAAAVQLDMIRSGTALVAVQALPYGTGGAPVLAAAPAPGPGLPGLIATAEAAEPTAGELPTPNLFLQVGAFGSSDNARQLKQRLERGGLQNVVIHYDAASQPALYRVRVGPIADVQSYDDLVRRAVALDVVSPHLVNESNPQPLPDAASGG